MKELDTKELIPLIAYKRIAHVPILEIIKELGIYQKKYYQIVRSDEYKEFFSSMTSELNVEAIAAWRASMTSLAKEAHRVLKEELKNNSLKAVELVVRSMGIDQPGTNQQAQNITVVLPDLDKKADTEV
jgi:hypothetical protein